MVSAAIVTTEVLAKELALLLPLWDEEAVVNPPEGHSVDILFRDIAYASQFTEFILRMCEPLCDESGNEVLPPTFPPCEATIEVPRAVLTFYESVIVRFTPGKDTEE